MDTAIGRSIERKDAWDKVGGRALYTDDLPVAGMLYARLLTSTCAHGIIRRVDISKALAVKGVKSILTGEQCPELFGPFVTTPQMDSPYGARSYAEHGIIGIPAALGNALSEAFGKELLFLPLMPELIWKSIKEDTRDSV